MAIYEVTPEMYELGQQFYDQGMEQLDHIAYDELLAKTAVLAGFVMSTSVLLSGPPGGGKTLLSRHAYRLFTDITHDDVATIPSDSELRPIELVGGTTEHTKRITDEDGKTRTETTLTEVKGIVQAHHKIIWADELTRINPWATNAILGATEDHELSTKAGSVPLDNLQVQISTMNPSETRQATFKVSAALASRHALGAIMGYNLTAENRALLSQGIVPNVDKIDPIASTVQLGRMREMVDNTMLGDTPLKRVVRGTEVARQVLADDYGIVEADRMAVQLGRAARTLGLFRGEKAENKDVDNAIRLMLGARIGSLVVGDSHAEWDKATEAVLAKVA